MKFCLFSFVAILVAVALAVFPICGGERAGTPGPGAAAAAKSVTIFPMVLTSDSPTTRLPANLPKDLAEVVGLMLERGGMKEIEIADVTFSPPEKADPAKVAEAFGQFVKSQGLRTEYALYGQFLGTPGKGVDEIRFAVVDRQGKVVLSGRRDRAQLGGGKVDPMIAGYRLAGELRGLWGLADPNRAGAPEGKMARLWAEKSGLPPKTEPEAMKSRLEALKKTAKTSTVAVYPTRVSGKSDVQVARRLADILPNAGFGRAQADTTDPNLQIQGNTNQTRIAWDIARAFQQFLRNHPPAADYALFVDYSIGHSGGKTEVGGVQFVLCDGKGDWVLLGLQNSHHPEFQRIDPQSADDCNRLVIEVLKNDLR